MEPHAKSDQAAKRLVPKAGRYGWLAVIPVLVFCLIRYSPLFSSTDNPKLYEDGIGTLGWLQEIRETVQHDGLLTGPLDVFSPRGIGGGLLEHRPISPMWKLFFWLSPSEVSAPTLYNAWLVFSIVLNMLCAWLLTRRLLLNGLATAAVMVLIACLENTDKRLGGHLGFVGMWGPLLLVTTFVSIPQDNFRWHFFRYSLIAAGVIAAFLNNEYYGFHGLVVACVVTMCDAARRLHARVPIKQIVQSLVGFAVAVVTLMLIFFPYSTTGMMGLAKVTFTTLRNKVAVDTPLAGHPIGDFENYGTTSLFSLFAPAEVSPIASLIPLDLTLWEHSFRVGLAVPFGILILAFGLWRRRRHKPITEVVTIYQGIILIAAAATASLIALKLSHPFSPAVLMYKVAPMFRVSARALAYGAIAAIASWGWCVSHLTQHLDVDAKKFRAGWIAFVIGITAFGVAEQKAFRPDGFHPIKTLAQPIPAALAFLAKEPRGTVINFPFHFRPKDPPEYVYDYYFGRACHHKPIVDGVEFYGHSDAHARFEAAGHLRDVSASMQSTLAAAGIKYIVVWGDFASRVDRNQPHYEEIFADNQASVFRARGPDIPYSSEALAKTFLLW